MLQLAVFDLDYTVWQPEMYQIFGPPSLTSLDAIKQNNRRNRRQHRLSPLILKGARAEQEGMIVTDRRGTPITIFDGASFALSEINKMKQRQYPIQTAVASRTDEPSWARKCMEWLTIMDGTTLDACFDHVEISFADKRQHFERLHRKTGIPYEDMCFFDNEEWNILSVAQLGVKCVYTPDGMTREAWNEALAMFNMVEQRHDGEPE